ncbi:hypothetical protein HO173_002898 [Letharia columbiana]|uniref:Uncharacterized protein n=1 Tax=Letharia columbiana TaxID=112416 RepID=A0A8H6L841_9LECA|nr:uncharacterized protein HO173_002898 [Letharia columbiana]KAF6239026.1 hypothetical protein HO173_002898 [Letharia columbiana]
MNLYIKPGTDPALLTPQSCLTRSNVTSAENAISAEDTPIAFAFADPLPTSGLFDPELRAMAGRYLPVALILLHLHNIIPVSATTSVRFYTDSSCKTLYATVYTDTDLGNGHCGQFSTFINSASSSTIDNGCSVTIYTDYCNSNATLVPLESCTSMSISSFSVDCPQINGTRDTGYITSRGTSVPSTISPSTSSAPVPPFSPQTLATDIPPTSFAPESQTPTSQPNPATGIPRPTQSSSTTFPSPETPTSPVRDLRPRLPGLLNRLPTSSSPSPSSSQGQKGSGNDGGLSGPSTIAIGVVLPGVGVIVAIIIGIVGVKRHRRAPRELPTRRWST